MVIKKTLQKCLGTGVLLVATLTLAACGGGSSSSGSKTDCVEIAAASGGVNVTNTCDSKVTVAFFDPLFRFSLEGNETRFLARTGSISFGACKGSSKPKDQGDGKFICD